jgi:hypothetical protein
MPVLHKYKDKEGYYILTSIKGLVVTFQLTSEGLEKLITYGIEIGKKFPRALLLDLYRIGDAYTYGTGVEESLPKIEARQLEFDFSDDSEPESMFPSCANCSSLNDLHLVEMKEKDSRASILCADCRLKKSKSIDTSIPLSLVNRGTLNFLLELKGIRHGDKAFSAYQDLLNAEFKNKWEKLAKTKKKIQKELFKTDKKGQRTLRG